MNGMEVAEPFRDIKDETDSKKAPQKQSMHSLKGLPRGLLGHVREGFADGGWVSIRKVTKKESELKGGGEAGRGDNVACGRETN